ncbi:16S rRNA (uracil(1498)-N(3))-methyltransferase [Brachybacterium sp. EF45031]|uniref:16S rRNA (uracil(1498)-N(3))-methyltransferase n=1 Tax=Brachybacterium sillae TaxID=2810536 RepID=UPI00217D82BD|nr:16S rRNA (uracil(1498)-N(3))-methyltransferase [Brachybacterium sillae]MCS6710769.1 16S rRNA (uracil(1498)-N(3))-methyltransferase [Brachybacterium sillae]
MPTTPPQFLLLEGSLRDLREGSVVELRGDEGRHAAKVARIGTGEQVLLTDADGSQVRCQVEATGKEHLQLRLLSDPSEPLRRRPRLALVQALATGGRDEQAVEAATELGVDRVTPWIADRSVSVWKGEKLAKGRAKWRATVHAAVKQCRRPGIPAVDEALTSRALAEEIAARVSDGGVVLVLHEQESARISTVLPQLRERVDAADLPEVTVVVGPEGGITEDELTAFREAGSRSVLLGPEVLRSSTAGPAAIAALSLALGRWD